MDGGCALYESIPYETLPDSIDYDSTAYTHPLGSCSTPETKVSLLSPPEDLHALKRHNRDQNQHLSILVQTQGESKNTDYY